MLSRGLIATQRDVPAVSHVRTQSPAEPLLCQFCERVLDSLSLVQRQEHYDLHFIREPPAAPVSTSKKLLLPFNRKPSVQPKDPFWHPALSVPPPRNYTPGLIPVLKNALKQSVLKGSTCRAVLCYEKTVHVEREQWDTNWGCGYRNYLMVCTALMSQTIQPMYFPLLDDPLPPSVRNLQRTIEAAWENGYDEEGAAQLSGKLVDTSKRIGTGDIYVAFTFRGIPAVLVDLNLKDEPRGVAAVTDWIVDYFTPAKTSKPGTVNDALRDVSAVTTTDKMPLILQHHGHSRTIVGYEVVKSGAVNLLMMDPSLRPCDALRNAGLAAREASYSQSFRALLPRSQSLSSSASQQTLLSSSVTLTQQTSLPSVTPTQQTSATSYHQPSISSAPLTQRTSMSSAASTKRPRPDPDVEEIIVISDSEDIAVTPNKKKNGENDTLNPSQVLKFFRLDSKRVGRQAQYQILYFPLDGPLDEREKARRKVVNSI